MSNDCLCSPLGIVSPRCPVHEVVERAALDRLRAQLAERNATIAKLEARCKDLTVLLRQCRRKCGCAVFNGGPTLNLLAERGQRIAELERRLDEAQAGAAAMRQYLDHLTLIAETFGDMDAERVISVGWWDSDDWHGFNARVKYTVAYYKAARAALATDAGKPLLAELALANEVIEAARTWSRKSWSKYTEDLHDAIAKWDARKHGGTL